jgi:hypothetical protein
MRTGNDRPRKKKVNQDQPVEATPKVEDSQTTTEDSQPSPEPESFFESVELG